MCLYTRYIKNGRYKKNNKNGGIPPEIIDPRVLIVPVGCGECMECRKQKAREWMIRLLEDIKTNTNGIFVTLTFSDESIAELAEGITTKGYKLDNDIAKKGMRRFLERWRKSHKKSVRHWMITELGHTGTKNVHLHGIIWTDNGGEEITRQWKYGFVWNGVSKNGRKQNYVNGRTVNYITKYIMKQDEEHPNYKPKILASAGIGGNYIGTIGAKKNKYNDKGTNETYRTESGHKVALPIYWRNKIYNDNEREQLWIERLNKGERWICGEQVSAEDAETQRKLKIWYRERNKELGYGNGMKNLDEREQEEAERQLLIETRIRKGKKK